MFDPGIMPDSRPIGNRFPPHSYFETPADRNLTRLALAIGGSLIQVQSPFRFTPRVPPLARRENSTPIHPIIEAGNSLDFQLTRDDSTQSEKPSSPLG